MRFRPQYKVNLHWKFEDFVPKSKILLCRYISSGEECVSCFRGSFCWLCSCSSDMQHRLNDIHLQHEYFTYLQLKQYEIFGIFLCNKIPFDCNLISKSNKIFGGILFLFLLLVKWSNYNLLFDIHYYGFMKKTNMQVDSYHLNDPLRRACNWRFDFQSKTEQKITENS